MRTVSPDAGFKFVGCGVFVWFLFALVFYGTILAGLIMGVVWLWKHI